MTMPMGTVQRRAASRRGGGFIPAGRGGFTLLEIMVAAAIGVLLMLALYVALDAQLRHVDAGREVVEESTLARALLARIGNDVAGSLPPVVPRRTKSGSSSSSAPASTGSTQGASSTASSSASTGSSTQSQETTTTETTSTGLIGPVKFNLGVQGDVNRVMLYLSRVPRELNVAGGSAAPSSDLRRVSYWLAGGASEPLGLARQELRLATAEEALGGLPASGDEPLYVIAEEVKSLEFRYYDGTAWQESWDGSTVGDTTTGASIGPPAAIEIKIGIVPAGMRKQPRPLDMPEMTLKYFRHVVAIPTANGPASSQK
jgi:prepilin-type N-terminal cleavage/methylation domain-containing protein